MNAVYTTVGSTASAEFEEKRSIFIGHACHVESADEAMEFIKAKQSEYRDATHNVWAYHMKNGVLARYSDDGEPTGTAGLPTLEAIRKSGVDDTCVVVTRYFGGILLGAGGLVRAYSHAAVLAVEAAGIVTYVSFSELSVTAGYADYQKIRNELPKFGAHIDGTFFADAVTVRFAVKAELASDVIEKISELTAGRAVPAVVGTRLDS